MDYKYIEQLIERYWQCETTLQEESILRSFFCQTEIPEELRQYQPLFACEEEKEEPLGDEFDSRLLELTEGTAAKAKVVTFTDRLIPLFRAAAIVAIVLTLGNAAQAPWDLGWNDPKEIYSKMHQEEIDSVSQLGTIQAENIADSTMAIPAETPAYYE